MEEVDTRAPSKKRRLSYDLNGAREEVEKIWEKKRQQIPWSWDKSEPNVLKIGSNGYN